MIRKIFILITISFLVINTVNSIDLSWCYKKTFKVSAYYSPIPGQSFYYKWSLYKERHLNWQWTHGASWKAVFNGMVAAPKNYKFWTKIYLPWLWVGQVEDRGQAIVSAGQRWEPYDRIDIWVWKWDEALMRALSFWKQIRTWYVCPSYSNIKVWFDYSSFPIFENFFEKTIWSVWLYFWRQDAWVKVLQDYLRELWYFNYKTSTWYFWELTKQAVANFQKDNGIHTKYYGYFWPQTRWKLKQVLESRWLYEKIDTYTTKDDRPLPVEKKQKTEEEKKKELVSKDLEILKRWLWKGYKTYEVKVLQKYLKELWYYNWDLDWYYGDDTVKAVANFQFEHGIINLSNRNLAGYFWPSTRLIFKKVVLESIINS